MTLGQALSSPLAGYTRLDETDKNISYTGLTSAIGQSNSSYNNSTYTILPPNATLSFNFVGTAFKILGTNGASLRVYIDLDLDDEDYLTSSLASSSTVKQVLFEMEGLKNKEHSVIVVNNGEMNSTRIDAIDILGSTTLLPFKSMSKLNKILLLSDNKTCSIKSEEILYDLKMTSNTAPAPLVASASSVSSSTYPAWKAFNGTNTGTSDSWTTNSTKNGWLNIDFGEQKNVNYVDIHPRNDSNYLICSPKNFEILGSSDGVNFEKLAEYSNVSDWVQVGYKRFTFLNNKKFKHYRLNVLENNGANTVSLGRVVYGYNSSSLSNLKQVSYSNFINYGSPLISNFNSIHTNKNYILQDTVSENIDGLWVQEIDRKPLSIKFE